MTEADKKEDRPLKVAMIAACPFPYPRGTPVRIHRLSSALANCGHDVHVFTYHLGEGGGSEAFTVERIPRIPTYHKRSPGPSVQKLLVVDPVLTVKLSLALSKQRFDVIHAHHYEGLLVAKVARAGRKIPLIYDAHTLLGSELPFFELGLNKRLVARLGVRLDRWLPGLADHVVAVTQRIKDKLVGYGMPDERVTVIANGVEHDLFPDAAAPESKEPPRLVFTGNLAAYQGIDHMLRAFERVHRERPEVRLLLVSESSFEPYEQLAEKLGIRSHVDLSPAPFSEHPAILWSSTIALNPRVECDGIPQKLLNYMAAGRPSVSFAGSAPCIEHGVTGWVVKNGDTDAFGDAIVHLLREPAIAARLGRAARAAVIARYTWDAAARQSEAVYRRLLREDRFRGRAAVSDVPPMRGPL